MPAPLVATDLHLAADIGGHLSAQITLDLEVSFYVVTKLDQLLVAELVDAHVGADPGGVEKLVSAGFADTEYVGQGDLDALVTREIDTNESCHQAVSLSFVEGVGRAAPLPRCPLDARRLTDGRAPAFVPGVTLSSEFGSDDSERSRLGKQAPERLLGGVVDQPCRCLWRGLSQITMTRPCRRITLHLSQIFLTLGLTFIELSM